MQLYFPIKAHWLSDSLFLNSTTNINVNIISDYFFCYMLKIFVMLTSLLLLIVPLILSKHSNSSNILLEFLSYPNIKINTLWSPQPISELRIRWKLLVFTDLMLFIQRLFLIIPLEQEILHYLHVRYICI